MQKIILVMNANAINMRSIDFAAYVAGLTQSKLTGLFVERVLHAQTAELKTPFALPYVETITATDDEAFYNKEEVRKKVQLFEDACIKRSVCFLTKVVKGDETDVVIKESRYADLLLVSVDTSFETGLPEGLPTKFTKALLTGAECPVIVTPETFDEINEIIFACDGKKSAVHAIKQFTYLFPQLAKISITLLYVAAPDTDDTVDNKMLDWLKLHYTDVRQETLHGVPSDELFAELLVKRNKFVVMGSFGRTLFSLALKPSTASLLLKTVNLPIFISHS